jgi:hypothetical protein
MNNRKLFESMDDKSKAFYSRLFNTCLLNIHAVRRGYFDTLICETEDPKTMLRWKAAVPQIVHMIRIDNMKADE